MNCMAANYNDLLWMILFCSSFSSGSVRDIGRISERKKSVINRSQF